MSLRNELGKDNKAHGAFQDLLVDVFELTQKSIEKWQGSNNEARRELIGILSLNRTLDDASLC
jgi:ClpP class serine protease